MGVEQRVGGDSFLLLLGFMLLLLLRVIGTTRFTMLSGLRVIGFMVFLCIGLQGFRVSGFLCFGFHGYEL